MSDKTGEKQGKFQKGRSGNDVTLPSGDVYFFNFHIFFFIREQIIWTVYEQLFVCVSDPQTNPYALFQSPINSQTPHFQCF